MKKTHTRLVGYDKFDSPVDIREWRNCKASAGKKRWHKLSMQSMNAVVTVRAFQVNADWGHHA